MQIRKIFQKNHNCKIMLGLILGLVIASTGVNAVNSINASDISYSNSNLSSKNVQGAIDELYNKVSKTGNFVEAYTYSEAGSNKCITGDESTCKETTCYKTKTANSCPTGTIIKYKVNDTAIVKFHVMFDKGSKLIMQSTNSIITDKAWYATSLDNTKGPLTVLPALEDATKSWSNVNDQTYTMGKTIFASNAYTGCSKYNSCTKNVYTLPERTAKSRMITLQEAVELGCTETSYSCPAWLEGDDLYWTMTAYPTGGNTSYDSAWYIDNSLAIIDVDWDERVSDARSVVEVNK